MGFAKPESNSYSAVTAVMVLYMACVALLTGISAARGVDGFPVSPWAVSVLLISQDGFVVSHKQLAKFYTFHCSATAV